MPRKSKYEEYVKPHVDNGDIARWAAFGANEGTIAESCHVSQYSFIRYKAQHKELRDALDGKSIKTQKMLDKLYDAAMKLATGHTEPIKKKKVSHVGDKVFKTEEVTDKYYPPNYAMLNKMLANLDPSWRSDDQTTVDLKKQKLELEKQKHEDSAW